MILLIILLLIFPASIHLLLRKRRKPGNHPPPPGPPPLPLVGNLLQFDTTSPHTYLWKLSLKHGPLMSMKLGSVPVLVVSSPAAAKEVMRTQDLAFCSRPRVVGTYKLSYNGLDVAFAPYSETWRELRKICVLHLLSNKQVQSFRSVRESLVLEAMGKLRGSASSGEAVDLSSMMVALTSSLICRVAFGSEQGGSGRFDELMNEILALQGGFFVSDYLPWLGWVDRVSGMIGRLDKLFQQLDDFFSEIIDQHLQVNSSNPNILDILIQLKKDKSGSIHLTWDHVKAILMDVFEGGTDTGAVTIIWAMTTLMKNPSTMRKLQNEVRQVVGERGSVNEDDLPKLPYLKAVIKEVLRLYPPAPLLLPRETLTTANIMGYTVPPKTLVFINAWAIARDPNYWQNPNEFKPERFLNTDLDIVGQDFQVIPFGAGRRGCPGISMGLATVELALANLVYAFDWSLPPGTSSHDLDVELMHGLTMHKKNPLKLVPKYRF